MDSEDGQDQPEINEEGTSQRERHILMLLSSIQDQIFVHTNLSTPDIASSLNFERNIRYDDPYNKSSCVIDLCNYTKNLPAEEIKEICIQTILADNTEQIISHKSSEIEAQSSLEMEQNLIEENNEDFGLKELSKGQKLSHDQLKFLKSTISQSSLTTTQISNEYRVSVSQINKIKRMNEQIILDGPKKKFIKLSKLNKKMITNEILKFIESNNNTFYATEITDFVNRKLS